MTTTRRLLIVDDDRAICDLIASVAEALGYHAEKASTATEIDGVLGHGHDLVLLDLSLGDTDGMRVMRQLGERQPGANLVLLTGADTSVLQGAAKVAELSGFHLVGACSKPIGLDELERVLRPQAATAATEADDEPAHDLEALVLDALDQESFFLLYQPIVRLVDDGDVWGAEALVRLDTRSAEHISPDIWVPIIERHGRSSDLLDVVFRIAAHDRLTVPALAALDNVSINLSVLDLARLDLPERAEAVLAPSAPPSRWTLEITETAEVDRLADALDVLIRLRLKGFHLSMDDFGTGSSTLGRLRGMPFTELKADRRYARIDAGDLEHAGSWLRAAVELGSALGIKVVAEGLETAEEVAVAREVGCDLAQGFYIGRPVRPEALGVLVASWNRLPLVDRLAGKV